VTHRWHCAHCGRAHLKRAADGTEAPPPPPPPPPLLLELLELLELELLLLLLLLPGPTGLHAQAACLSIPHTTLLRSGAALPRDVSPHTTLLRSGSAWPQDAHAQVPSRLPACVLGVGCTRAEVLGTPGPHL